MQYQWPGYQPWGRQIPTRDFRDHPPRPITRAKLAKNVAESVARFIAVSISSHDREIGFTGHLRNTKAAKWKRMVTKLGLLDPGRSTYSTWYL
jgi:hypothetical protein